MSSMPALPTPSELKQLSGGGLTLFTTYQEPPGINSFQVSSAGMAGPSSASPWVNHRLATRFREQGKQASHCTRVRKSRSGVGYYGGSWQPDQVSLPSY